MKHVLLSLIVIGFATTASAEVTLMNGEPFKLRGSAGIPYQDCRTLEPAEHLAKTLESELTQKARIQCQSDVEIVGFEVLKKSCGAPEDRFDVARATVEGTFKCKEIQKKIRGIGYVVYKAGTAGPDVHESADRDAMGQCGSNIVRTSEYAIDGEASFSRVYYKYGNVRMMTRAEYECVK